MNWTESLEPIIAGYVEQAMQVPMVRSITDGTLDPNIFATFIAQDMLYLNAFRGSIVILAERMPHKHKSILREFAYSSVNEERAIQQKLAKDFDITDPTSIPSPATAEYMILERYACMTMPIEMGLSVLLPCFWLYFEIIKEINRKTSKKNRYAYWIKAYCDESFENDIKTYRALCDEYASDTQNIENMNRIFTQAADMELRFWNQEQ